MPVKIDTRFVDVDIIAEAKKANRKLGDTSIVTNELFAAAKDFSDSIQKEIPRNEWKDMCEAEEANGGSVQEKCTLLVHDQNGDPSCVSNAMVGMHEELQIKQFGIDRATKLSPMSLYFYLGSRSSGSSIDGNVKRCSSIGALPLTGEKKPDGTPFAHTKNHNGYSKNPDGFETTAADFRIDASEMYKITELGQFVTALLTGWSVIYARDGHSILAKRWVLTEGGVFMLEYLNSWGIWGAEMDGAKHLGKCCGLDSEKKVARAAYGYAARKIIYPSYITVA